ncbi:Schlafen-like protein 1 [Mactra antiquata]
MKSFTNLFTKVYGSLLNGSSPEEVDETKQYSNRDNDEGTPYYRPGEMIYNNDLSKEFKSYLDGRYTLKQIRDHVSRCVCAFLNTGTKGMLLIGVDSRGMVVGIDCNNQQEDRYRRHFLDAIKDIYPPVFGEEYSLHFSPLLEDNGRQHRKYIICKHLVGSSLL